jgi:hypothetical protein
LEERAMTTFTQEAEEAFLEASAACDKALATNNEHHKIEHMNAAIQDIAYGLAQLSRGLRATYIRIEQLESTIRQLDHRGGGLLGR